MPSVDVRVDVSGRCPFARGRRLEIAATVHWPEAGALAQPAVALFALPGGGYSRAYFDLEFPGHEGYSEARHHTERGLIVVAYDPLGCGDSTVPETDDLTIEQLAHASDAAVREIVRLLERGSVAPELPPMEAVIAVGVGQSMGGCLTIVMQGRHRTFDAVAILGYSAIHTVPPLRDPQQRAGLIEATRALTRDTDVTTLSIPERTRSHTHDDMSYPHHWENVPPDIRKADTPNGFPFRREGAWPPRWRSASLPRCALLMLAPHAVRAEAAVIYVPVLIAVGERDVCPEPHAEPAAYRSSRDVSLFIVPNMAHMHNFASTRARLWNRLVTWAQTLVSVS